MLADTGTPITLGNNQFELAMNYEYHNVTVVSYHINNRLCQYGKACKHY